MPGTRSIFGLKMAVKSDCQAALFDGVVSLAHLSVKKKDCCQSQIQELRRVDLRGISLSGRQRNLRSRVQLWFKICGARLLSKGVTRWTADMA